MNMDDPRRAKRGARRNDGRVAAGDDEHVAGDAIVCATGPV